MSQRLDEIYKDYCGAKLREELVSVCKAGYLDIAKYLLENTKAKKEGYDLSGYYGEALIGAANYGRLELTKYLIESLTYEERRSLSNNNTTALISACWNGHLDVVQYLLTAPEMDKLIKIHMNNDDALASACSKGYLDVVKYLMESKDIKENSKFNIGIFKMLVDNEQSDMLHYFIIDLNVERTEEMNQYLLEHSNKEVEKLFEARELVKDLKDNLSNKDINTNKKNKI